jgi:4-hydroxy-3-polyprenylbenzoate decarboxylase
MSMTGTPSRHLVVGISGASGAAYGVRILQVLQGSGIETHLVMSESARLTLASETEFSVRDVEALATEVHHPRNIGATIASGSFRTLGMVVAPCSIRSLSEIAYGNTSGLLTRAADVVLKERRRLVLLVRETPLHNGHLKAMLQASENGAVIMPPVPALYARPQSIAEMIDHTVGRCLDLFDIDTELVRRWRGLAGD